MALNLWEIPKTEIGENRHWRDWFYNLGTYVQQVQSGNTTWDVAVGGTGRTSFPSGNLVVGNGTHALSSIATIPYTKITGLATVAHTGVYSDLTGTPPAGLAGTTTIDTAKLTSGGAIGSMTFTDGILTAQVAAT
jgi:hypothetical protein